MYHYFNSKDDLLRAVFDNCMAILSEAFANANQQSEPQKRGEFCRRKMRPPAW